MKPRSILLKLCTVLVLFAPQVGLFPQDDGEAAEEYPATPYSLGDQIFSIHLGTILPLFYYAPSDGKTINPNLTVGGSGNIEWTAFLNQHLSIGGNLGGSFMQTPSGDTLLLVPVTLVASWTFQIYPFDIPIFARTGINFTRRSPELFVGPLLQAGTGFYWNMNSSWAFGINGTYTWIPLFHTSGGNSDENRFGNFFEIKFGAVFHF